MMNHDPDLLLRRAIPADANPIRRLVRETFQMYVPRMGRESSPMQDDYTAIVNRDIVWKVVSYEGLAAVMILRPDKTSMMLETIAVSHQYQGRGIGGALLDLAEVEARKYGHATVSLYTHETMAENIAIYTGRGYVETRREPYLGMDVVHMSKQLGHALAA